MSKRKTLVLEGAISHLDWGTHFSARIDRVNGHPSVEYAIASDHFGEPLPLVYGGGLIDTRGKRISAAIGDRVKFVLSADGKRFLQTYVRGVRTRL